MIFARNRIIIKLKVRQSQTLSYRMVDEEESHIANIHNNKKHKSKKYTENIAKEDFSKIE